MRRAAACVLAVLATALAWPPARPAQEPFTRVLTVAVTLASGPDVVGSGFVAGPGRVVTVAHLLERGSSIEVRSPGGPARGARPLRIDRRSDLALLAVPGLRGRPLQTTGAGDEVRLLLLRDGRAVTSAARVRRHIRAHVQAAPGARPRSRPALELAARIAAGDSGAPVVSAGGELAGVLFARSRDHARVAYAVDAAAVEGLTMAPQAQEGHGSQGASGRRVDDAVPSGWRSGALVEAPPGREPPRPRCRARLRGHERPYL